MRVHNYMTAAQELEKYEKHVDMDFVLVKLVNII